MNSGTAQRTAEAEACDPRPRRRHPAARPRASPGESGRNVTCAPGTPGFPGRPKEAARPVPPCELRLAGGMLGSLGFLSRTVSLEI